MKTEQVAKFALGLALIVPAALAGKFVGAGVGALVGGFVAFSVAESGFDFIKSKFTIVAPTQEK